MQMHSKKGFTLIELLIVVVIIGILAAIAIPKFASTKEKAYLASMKSDLRNLVTAEEAYFSDNQTYLAGSASNLSGVATPLDATTGFVPSAGVTIAVAVTAGPPVSWDATASMSATAKKCYIFENEPGPIGTATVEGEPKCDP